MTQTEKILEMLERAGDKGVLNTDLNSVAFRYSARLADLRKQGYRIRSTHIKGSIWRFTLLEEDASEHLEGFEPQYAEFRELLKPSACCGEIVVDGFCGGCREHV